MTTIDSLTSIASIGGPTSIATATAGSATIIATSIPTTSTSTSSTLTSSSTSITSTLVTGTSGSRNLTVPATPSASPSNAPQGVGMGPKPSGMAVGIGISLGFAFVVAAMTFWHLVTRSRLRRQQERLMAQYNYASDEPFKPGPGTSSSYQSESVELLAAKSGDGGKLSPMTAVYPVTPSPPGHSPLGSDHPSPSENVFPGRPVHPRFQFAPRRDKRDSPPPPPRAPSRTSANSGQG